MKLERLHEYILPTVVILVGVLLAVYTGHLSGNGQTSTLSSVLAVLIFGAALLIMRERIWTLIPIFWVLQGQIAVLPVPFSVRDLAVMATFVAFLILKATKIVRLKPKMSTSDRWMFVMLLYLATVYIRNPVGVEALGSEKVGGRPYFEVGIGCLAYWVLARSFLSPKQSRFFPLWLLGSRIVDGVLNLIVYLVPSLAPVMSEFYSGVSLDSYNSEDLRKGPAGESTDRQTYLAGPGTGGVLVACSYWRPLTVINPIYIIRFIIFMVSFGAVLLTGFRSGVLGAMMAVVISSYIRRGFSEILPLIMLGVPALVLIVAMQGTILTLPTSAQRALSFLPGHWDEYAVAEAHASTEWRLYMWRIMLTEDKYIQSKWLGDGFGFTQRELAVMIANQFGGDTASQQENFLITGGVHSGPLSTIRYVGYVGLAIYLVVLGLIARDAWQIARRSLGTPFLPLTLFVGIPLIWEPINFIFIFGGYEASLPTALFSLGMLKLLTNSLDAYERKTGGDDERPQRTRGRELTGLRPALAGTGSSAAF